MIDDWLCIVITVVAAGAVFGLFKFILLNQELIRLNHIVVAQNLRLEAELTACYVDNAKLRRELNDRR